MTDNTRWTMTEHTSIWRDPGDPGRFRVRPSLRSTSGKRITRTRTLQKASLQEAIETRDRLLEEIQRQLCPAPAPPGVETNTVACYAIDWLKRRSRRCAETTMRTYTDALTDRILPFIGHLQPEEVTRRVTFEWVAWAEGQRKEEHGEQVKYRTPTLRGWWRVYKQLVRDMAADYGLRDPCLRVRPPNGREDRLREERTLDHDTLATFLEAFKLVAPERHAEVLTLACTGLRSGELYGLDWPDVDFEEGLLHVRRSYSRGVLKEPKNGERSVWMPPELLEALRTHRAEQAERLGLDHVRAGIVFPSNTGGRRLGSSLYKRLDTAAELADIDIHVRPQVLRRSYNNMLRRAGVDRIVLRAQVGHASEEMTAWYSDVELAEKRESIGEALAGIF